MYGQKVDLRKTKMHFIDRLMFLYNSNPVNIGIEKKWKNNILWTHEFIVFANDNMKKSHSL